MSEMTEIALSFGGITGNETGTGRERCGGQVCLKIKNVEAVSFGRI